jgi:hypothetical protein
LDLVVTVNAGLYRGDPRGRVPPIVLNRYVFGAAKEP